MRAFTRLFILILPLLYGPYFAELANSTTIGFAVAFSVITSLALEGLFRIRIELEDPFELKESSMDAIHVESELGELLADLMIFSDEPSSVASAKVKLYGASSK